MRLTIQALVLAGLSTLFTSGLFAQHDDLEIFCKHNDPQMLSDLIGGDPVKAAMIASDEAALEQFTQQYTALPESMRGGANYVIPVVFHIIHDNGSENISDAQVHDAMRVLNTDFNKLNADTASVSSSFSSLIADIGVEFRLAQKDPFGNCTKGINRIQNDLTYSGDQDMKNLIQWPRDMYLNVWVAAYAQGAAGYTYRPGSVNNNFASALDGIVLLHNYTGSIGTSNAGRSRTLTHEVGHWINLKHLWGGTNDPGLASNCGDDDNVGDTPNTTGWTGCNLTGVTCGSLDNVENYMEYAYCSKMFTEGQKTRMLASLNSGTADRNELWTLNNLIATGTDGIDVLCAADFAVDRQTLCEGDSIQFVDNSYHGITQRTWSFAGGSPASSAAESPWVVFNTAGVYDVTLVAGNGTSTVSENRSAYITVLPSNGNASPYEESFESVSSIPNSDWLVVDLDGDGTWMISASAAYTGSNSIMIDNDAFDNGRVDEVLGTTVDMSNATDINISFRWAYARRASADDDVLRLYVSRDCGATWSMRKQIRGTNGLSTAVDQNSNFMPSGANDWGYEYVDNISTSYHVSDFRFKFWFESDGGNNIYLDDINVNGQPVGINELELGGNIGLTVFPSPVSSNAQVILNLEEAGAYTIELFNSLGQSSGIVLQGIGSVGSQQLDVHTEGLSAGVYLLKAVQEDRTRVVRFVKE